MSQKVDGIINSLSELESDIDSVNISLVDMKKSLNSIAQKEIDSLLEQTRRMATSEAESMISNSKSSAESESQKITQDGQSKVAENIEEKELEVQIFSDDDISLVAQQANVDEEAAKNALAEAEGDLARAILLLTTN